MGIKLKFLFKSIWEKKIRTLLIIFAVTIATALAFSSLGIADSFRGIVEEKYKISFGNSDLYIVPDEESGKLIELDKIDNKNISDKLGILNLSGVYKGEQEDYTANILAVDDMSNIEAINPLYITDKNIDINKLNKNDVIISDNLAEESQLKIGDEFIIELNGEDIDLRVGAIVAPKGLFSEKPGVITIIGSSKWFGEVTGNKDVYSQVLLKLDNNDRVGEVKEILREDLGEYYIDESLDSEMLGEAVNQYMVPFYIMLALVLLMSSFIIFSSFKVIALERLEVIGTFRSIGSTKISTDFLLILEAALYGIVGGAIGIMVGIPALYYLSDNANQYKDIGVQTVVNINPLYIIVAIIIALVLVVVSALIPIINTSKISVKDVILGTYSTNEKGGYLNLVLGIILIIISFAYIFKYRDTGNLILSVATAFFVIIGTALIVPYIMMSIGYIFKEVFRFLLGNEGFLAINNTSTSKVLSNNVILLTVGLAVVIIVNSATYSVGKMNEDIYNYLDYKVSVDNINSRNWDMIKNDIDDIYNVTDYYENFYMRNVDVKDADYNIGLLSGIDEEKFNNYYKEVEFKDDSGIINSDDIFRKLNEDKNIIVSDVISNKYKIKVGDTIEIKIKDEYKEYNVVGFISSYYSKINKNCLISKKNFMEGSKQEYPNSLLINGNGDMKELSKDIKNSLLAYNVEVKSIDKEKEASINENASIMTILEGFSFMALLIGGLGIANNLLVSFIQRKKELAVLASAGMSKVQRGKMIIIEGIVIALAGVALGILLSEALMVFVPEVIISLDAYLNMQVPEKQTIMLILISGVLVVVSSVIPVLKSSKISIIKEIKYE